MQDVTATDGGHDDQSQRSEQLPPHASSNAEAHDFLSVFLEHWPRVARRLTRSLRPLVSPADIEDIVQEVGSRTLRHQPPVDSGDDLYVWCWVVARNEAVGRWRKNARVQLGLEDVPEQPTADRAFDRARFTEALEFVNRSPFETRRAVARLFAPVDEQLDPAERQRDYLRIKRLRRRLRDALGGLYALAFRIRMHVPAATADATLSLGALAVAGALAVLGAAPDQPTQPVRVTTVAVTSTRSELTAIELPTPTTSERARHLPVDVSHPAVTDNAHDSDNSSTLVARIAGPNGQPAGEIVSSSDSPQRPLLCVTLGGPLEFAGTECAQKATP